MFDIFYLFFSGIYCCIYLLIEEIGRLKFLKFAKVKGIYLVVFLALSYWSSLAKREAGLEFQ